MKIENVIAKIHKGHLSKEQLNSFAVFGVKAMGGNSKDIGNYRVLSVSRGKKTIIACGTRDYCIGYRNANNEGTLAEILVLCGDMIVYPEDKFGEMVNL